MNAMHFSLQDVVFPCLRPLFYHIFLEALCILLITSMEMLHWIL